MIRLKKMIIYVAILVIINGCNVIVKLLPPSKDPKVFKDFTQQEKKAYILDYLKEEYNLECTIEKDVEKKFQGTFYYDEDFSTFVRTPKGNLIDVWVSDHGKVTDTFFLYQMKPEITKFFEDIVKTKISNVKVDTNTDLYSIPTKKITSSKDIEDFLIKENACTFLRIFIDDPSIDCEKILEELKPQLQFYEVDVEIYICDDLEHLDMNEYHQLTKIFESRIFKEKKRG